MSDLYSVYQLVLEDYVDPVDPQVLVQGAMRGFKAGAVEEGLLPVESDIVDLQPAVTTQSPTAIWAPFGIAYTGFLRKIANRMDIGLIGQATARGMLDALDDAHTSFIDSRSVQELQTENPTGIGVVLWSASGQGSTIVREVLPGGPAAAGGVHVGDEVLAVDGRSLENETVSEAAVDIRGVEGTSVLLTLRSPGESVTHDVTLTRAAVQRDLVQSAVRDGFAYIRIAAFQAGVAQSVRNALSQSVARGDRGWIIDLRGNGGGDLQEVAATGAAFIGSATLAIEIDRSGQGTPLRSPDVPVGPRPPIIVLVDGSTASGAEVLAAALHEYKFATLVGQKTAGAVGVAATVPLHDGSEVEITAEKLVTPSGMQLNKVGLAPDEEVTSNVDDWVAGRDPELDRAIALLMTTTNE